MLLLLWALGFVCASLLISDKLDVTPANGLVFNEMLVRLLHGRFDISPATIGDEAIVHGGRTYAYFGVFCALLRLPLVLTARLAWTSPSHRSSWRPRFRWARGWRR